MILNIICVTLIVLAAATVANTIELKTKNNNVSFKEAMELLELPVVTLNVNNNKLKFIIDTGCTTSCINESIVKSLNIETKNIGNTHYGIDGNKVALNTCTIDFKLKNKNYSFDFNTANMDKVFTYIKESEGVQIHGLLGSDFLDKYNYVVDYKDYSLYKK